MAITLSAGGANGNSLTNRDGWEYITKCSWVDQDVSHVYFSLDKKKYEQFILNMYTDGSPLWSGAYMEFMTGPNTADELGGLSSVGWANSTSYMGSNFTSPNYTNAAGNDASYGWLAGDGSIWLGHSMCLISVPDTALNWASVRSMGGLSTNESVVSTPYSYVEDAHGVCKTKYGREITGIRIFGSGGGTSRRGSMTLHGIKK